MQKYNEPCIKTNDFALLCNTNKRTLIHYDEIGLFKPAYTDERGYRYYSESQCDTFFMITCLKDLGMPLKKIKVYIDARNPEDLASLLLEQKKKVRDQLSHLQRIQQVIENKLDLLYEGQSTRIYDRCSTPYIEKYPAETLLISPYLGTREHEELFVAICNHIAVVNQQNQNIGHPYGAMMTVGNLQQGIYDEYAYFMTKVSDSKVAATKPQAFSYHQKPGGLYAVIYLKGDYYEAEEAFETLLKYIHENELTPGEFCYKEAVWDELTVHNKEDYITRISIPVK